MNIEYGCRDKFKLLIFNCVKSFLNLPSDAVFDRYNTVVDFMGF